VILRPPGVYGPRDGEFLRLFKAVKAHVVPRFGGDRQALSLVFAKDLAEAAVVCLTHPAAAGKTYFVASPDVTTLGALAEAIAKSMGVWTMPLPLPMAVLWPVCAVQEAVSRLTGKPSVFSRQKYPELTVPGWVCDASRLRADTGCVCATDLRAGIAETLRWYRENAWL
jgi:nucleoside-diphosphate-sugar epimerase